MLSIPDDETDGDEVEVVLSYADGEEDQDCHGEAVCDTEVVGVKVIQLVADEDVLMVTIGVIDEDTEIVYVSPPEAEGDADDDLLEEVEPEIVDVPLYREDKDEDPEEDLDALDVIVYVVEGVLLGIDGSAD